MKVILLTHGHKAFLPQITISFYRSLKLIKQQKPLISGYFFVKDTGISTEKLRFIPGSCGLLIHCGKPVTVADEDIRKMERLCCCLPVPELISSLVNGQRIRITEVFWVGLKEK